MLVLYVIYNVKYSKRLINDKVIEFDEKYGLIDRKVATEILAERQQIINNCLVFGDNQALLDECDIVFHCKTLSGVYYFSLIFYSKQTGEFLERLELDQALCTYLKYNDIQIKNSELFSLFLTDKTTFMKLLLKYNDEAKMQGYIQRSKNIP